MRRRQAAVMWCVLVTAASAHAFTPMLPDARLTPGKVATGAADLRGVTAAMENEVFARYRIVPERRRAYKIDHLIPRELGGADDVKNLWPQRISARPYTARRKEVLTAHLLQLVAAGELTLAQAQQEMREDWISSFITRIGMVYLSPRKMTDDD